MQKLIIILLFIPFLLSSQNISTEPFTEAPSFIKNKGQFDNRNWQKANNIEYACDFNKAFIFFTKGGLTYRFDKIIRNPNKNEDDFDSPKRTNISELINVTWLDANPNTEIVAEEKVENYYSYAIKNLETKEVRNENYIDGFRKLTYKNLYDNIDVVYTIHPQTGIKYSIILHPGGDLSKVQMKYSSRHTSIGQESIIYGLDDNGEIQIKTSLNEITEHRPYTFYNDSKEVISSSFKFENDILSFNLDIYDNTREIIIDPWVESPTFSTSTAVWEVETDGIGNVYVIGGETPMQLKKYNSTGTIQWTYTTPWDTASVWLGTLATNNAGVSFITSGTTPEIERVSTAGAMAWHNASGGIFSLTEWWSITFNCDKTKLIVGGTGGSAPPLGTPKSVIYEMDITNGNVIGQEDVHVGASGGFMASPIEVRSISSSKDAKYIFLTHLHVGAIMDNIGACPQTGPIFKVDNGHHLGYKCENYLPATQNGGGLKALIANDQYIYTNSGNQIHQRLLTDGTLVNTVALPGGNSNTIPIVGGLEVENSGMAVDDCGNVYAGSGDRVVKFDANLNILSQVNVPFTVYDVSVNSNGEVLACGAQQDNQAVNRNGRIQSIDMNACAQFALVCCDANICPVDTVCLTDPAFNIDVSTPGGTFSGTGITNTTTGIFDPSVAGAGTHIITYSQPCGSETVAIVVDPCVPITVCSDGTNLIASGGTGTIVWDDWESYNYPINTEQECIDCPTATPQYMPIIGIYTGCDVSTCTGNGWTQFATGTTVSPPANWPMQVSDNNGVAFTYNNIGEVPPCSACTPPTLSSSVTNVSCSGGSDGAINLTVTPGSGSTFTYSWTGPSGYTNTSEDISGLLAGTYNVTVTDATNASCFATLSVTVNPGAATQNASFTFNSFCEGSSNSATGIATPGGTFTFNPSPTNGETINASTGAISGGIGGNSYIVQYTTSGACPGTSTQNVIVYANPTPSISGSTSFCTGGSTTLNAGSYTSYLWSTSATTQTINVNTAGTYIVTVTDANGCTGTDQVDVTVSSSLTPNITGILSICSGAATTLDAGSGYAGYLWSTSATTQTINVSTGGTYSVTVSDASGCTGTDQVVVTANTNPSPNITGSLSFCTGGSTILDAGAGYSTYVWSPSGATQTINVNSAGTYSVTVTDANGCTGTDQVDVTVAANLTPSITGVLTICSGSATILDAGAGYAGYWWSTSASTQTINVTTAGTYTVTVSDASGCTGSDQVNVTTNTNPTPNITGALSFCTGGSTTLDAGLYAGYLWSTGSNAQTINVTTAGTFGVTVTDVNGCTGTDQVVVSVSSSLTPNIIGILSICSGAATVLDAGNGYAGYLWSTTDITQTINVTAAGAYSVTVSDASGCTGTDNVTVTTSTNPSPSITGILSFCPGGSTTLDAGSGYSNYSWSPSGSSQSISVSNIGTYAVTVTDANGCTGTDQVDVIQSSSMVATLTPTNIVCNGGTGSIDLNIVGGTPPYSYVWNTGAITEDLNGVSIGSYSVTITDASGCTANGSASLSEPAEIIISVSSSQTICNGQSATINVSVVGGVQPYTYIWSHANINSPTIYVSPSSETVYSVYVEDANGCMSNTATTTVTVSPPLQLQVVASTENVCPGNPAIITVSPSAGAGPPYMIYVDNSIQSPPIVVYPNGTTTYNVTAIDGCGSEATQAVTINVFDLPPISFQSDTLEGCQPLTVNFTENSPDIGQSYSWNFGDLVNNNLSFDQSPAHIYEDPGVYTVTLTVISAEGCSNTQVVSDMITVYPNPISKFIADPEVVSVIKPMVYFTNLSLLNDSSYWYFGDGDSSNAVNPVHAYPQYPTGTYMVELITSTQYGCRDTAYGTIIVEDEYTFYAPTAFSPDFDGVNDIFLVKGNGIDNRNFKMYIYDRWGEIVFESDDIYQGWDGSINGGDIGKIGTYTWLVIYQTNNQVQHQEAGAVTIIR